jgi:hypothetical protein
MLGFEEGERAWIPSAMSSRDGVGEEHAAMGTMDLLFFYKPFYSA